MLVSSFKSQSSYYFLGKNYPDHDFIEHLFTKLPMIVNVKSIGDRFI